MGVIMLKVWLAAGVICLMMTFADAKPRRHHGGGSVSLAHVVAPLAEKAHEIVRDCGSRIVSTTNRGGVTPNHRNGRAVDIQGNPSCIYAHLNGWPGGVSTDYNTAPGTKHVHFSYCPRCYEWGKRFVHHHRASKSRFATRRQARDNHAI